MQFLSQYFLVNSNLWLVMDMDSKNDQRGHVKLHSNVTLLKRWNQAKDDIYHVSVS